MNSAATASFRPPIRSILSLQPPISSKQKLKPTQFNPNQQNHRSISHLKQPTVTEKLKILVSEFKTLTEPIDRVKRLLHYANLLPEFNQSSRTESNKVTGCTAQVWLEVAMDNEGLMRFRVDSDSEITKGFCYCLIWLLDGENACDVFKIRVDDLGEMNVGILPIRVSSRVHTWHNVLISMQTRTRNLIMENCSDHSCISLLK